jgi:hypothetical protein
MKKILILMSMVSVLLTSCELTVGDNVNSTCQCCTASGQCGKTEEPVKDESVENGTFPTDEYTVEEDTTENY